MYLYLYTSQRQKKIDWNSKRLIFTIWRITFKSINISYWMYNDYFLFILGTVSVSRFKSLVHLIVIQTLDLLVGCKSKQWSKKPFFYQWTSGVRQWCGAQGFFLPTVRTKPLPAGSGKPDRFDRLPEKTGQIQISNQKLQFNRFPPVSRPVRPVNRTGLSGNRPNSNFLV